jgi:hypothetical protein
MVDKEAVIKGKIQDIGTDCFPDDEVDWNVLGIQHHGVYTAVESKPSGFIGYEKFKFILTFKQDGEPHVEGCYRWEGGQWLMLFTDPATKTEEWKGLFRS